MRIYVETNFIQELTLLHAQAATCENILELCEGGKAEIIIPAFSIVEPVWKIIGNRSKRIKFREELQSDWKELSRGTGYEVEIGRFKEIDTILTRVINDEQNRFTAARERILQIAEVIPLDAGVFDRCKEFAHLFTKFTDTVVCASIISHLENSESDKSCFLNIDGDFYSDPDVKQLFTHRKCSIMGFGEGLGLLLGKKK